MNQEHPSGHTRGAMTLVAGAWKVIMGDKGGYALFVGKLLLCVVAVSCIAFGGIQAVSMAKMQGAVPLLAYLALIAAALLTWVLIGTQWLIRLDEHLVLQRPLVLALGDGLCSKRLFAVAGWRFAFWLPSSILGSMVAFMATKLVLPFSQTAFALTHFVLGFMVAYGCFFLYLESLRAIFRLRECDSGWAAIRKRKPLFFFLSWVVTALIGLIFQLTAQFLPLQALPAIAPRIPAWAVIAAIVLILSCSILLGLVLAVAEGLCLKDTLAGHRLPGQALSSRRSWWYITRPEQGPLPDAKA